MNLPKTHRYTEKQIKRIEGKDLDRMVGLALGDYRGEGGQWYWPHTDSVRDEAAPYSTHPLYVEHILVVVREVEIPVSPTGSLSYHGLSVKPYWEDEWLAGPHGHDGMWSLADGDTPMLALSRAVAICWKRGVLPVDSF